MYIRRGSLCVKNKFLTGKKCDEHNLYTDLHNRLDDFNNTVSKKKKTKKKQLIIRFFRRDLF